MTDLCHGGRLTEEQSERFIATMLDNDLMSHSGRVYCYCCGVSWPFEAPELECTCAPNEIREAASAVALRFRRLALAGKR